MNNVLLIYRCRSQQWSILRACSKRGAYSECEVDIVEKYQTFSEFENHKEAVEFAT